MLKESTDRNWGKWTSCGNKNAINEQLSSLWGKMEVGYKWNYRHWKL